MTDLKIGVHMLRKTAYLLALWGGGKFHHIMGSARHTTYPSARLYAKDALSLKELSNIYNHHDNQVGKWQTIVASQLSQAARLNMQLSAFRLPLPKLAKTFVLDSLQVPKATHNDQQLLIEAALKYVEPSAPEVKLKKYSRRLGLRKERLN